VSTQIFTDDTIKIDIEPLSFEVEQLGPLGNKTITPPVKLEVNSQGMSLAYAKKNKQPVTFSSVDWGALRELKNDLRKNGRFSYYGIFRSKLAETKMVIRLRVKGGPSEWERLACIFDRLPPGACGRMCPACAGPVIDNVCRNCGKSFTGQQRMRGLKFLGSGVVIGTVGIALTASSYNSSSGAITVFYGLMILGLGLIVGGLISLIFGVRT